MSLSDKDFPAALFPQGNGSPTGDEVSRGDFRASERALARYFSVPAARENVSSVIFIGTDDPLYNDITDFDRGATAFLAEASKNPVVEIDLGEEAGLNEMIQKWIRECEHSDPKAAFKSMYKILSTIENSGNGEGALSIEQHSRILKNAAGAAISSSMPPENKFIALSGLLKFVGPPQQPLADKIIAPSMREQAAGMSCEKFCDCIVLAYVSNSWEADDENHPQSEDVIIDGVAVVLEETPDATEDFNKAHMGDIKNRDLVREVLRIELQKNPNKLLPLLAAEGDEGVRSLLLSMEQRGDIREVQIDDLPKLLKAEQARLLGHSIIDTPEI